MNRNTKKGFTVVELIIVIAVIAVLAAVLIPTFSNLIGKAQEAKDTALVRNLNEALAMDTTTSKHLTMSDAVAAVRNNGIDISKIKATVPGNAILWDSVNDLFAYYKVDKEGNSGDKVYYIPEYSADAPADGRLFAVVSDSNAIATSKYGVYYTGSNVDSVTVNGVGFDAGSAQIGTVVYNGSTSGATVDIRTNGGRLTIDAEKDTVRHFGEVETATIEKCAMNSYHEFGKVIGTLEIKEGHVKVETNGEIGSINISAESSTSFKISAEVGSSIGFITADDCSVIVSTGANANVTVSDNKIIQEESAKNAVLYNSVVGYKDAWDESITSGITTLLKDMTYTKTIYFNNGSDLTIDLNGHEFNTDLWVPYNNKILCVKDTSSNKAGVLNLSRMQIGAPTENLPRCGNLTINGAKVVIDQYINMYYGELKIEDSSISGYIAVNGISKFSNRLEPHITISANNSSFEGPLYLAGFGNYTFTNNTFNQDGFPLYFKAGNIYVANNTFNVNCENDNAVDYVYYGNGAFDQNTAIMIDEAPGYKGFGEVEIGAGNKFNFNGTYASNYYQVMYNIIPESTETAHVVIANDITKTCTARDFVAKRSVTFEEVDANGNKRTGVATMYFTTLEKANAYTEEAYKKAYPQHTITSYTEVIELS